MQTKRRDAEDAENHSAAEPQSDTPQGEGRGMNGRGIRTGESVFHSAAVHSPAAFRLEDLAAPRPSFAAREDSGGLQCRDFPLPVCSPKGGVRLCASSLRNSASSAPLRSIGSEGELWIRLRVREVCPDSHPRPRSVASGILPTESAAPSLLFTHKYRVPANRDGQAGGSPGSNRAQCLECAGRAQRRRRFGSRRSRLPVGAPSAPRAAKAGSRCACPRTPNAARVPRRLANLRDAGTCG